MNSFKGLTFIGLPLETEKLFREVVAELGLIDICSFEQTVQNAKQGSDLIIYHVAGKDLDLVKTDLNYFRSTFPKSGIVMAMPDKNFDILLQAFYYNIRNILVAPFDGLDLKQALMKSRIIQEASTKLPTRELLRLFSKPMKNTEINSLYGRLSEYFKVFDSVKDFSCFRIEGDKVTLLFGIELKNEDLVSELKSSDKTVGTFTSNEVGEEYVATFPLINEDKVLFVGVLILEKNDIDFIVNSYLLDYIIGTSRQRTGEQELTKLANTDEITGLYNQRKLSEDLEKAIITHERNHEKFSIMFIDVDHFKIVNDNWGHIVGSDMLFQMGMAIKNILRGSDYVYRYGGDEFVVIMPNVSVETVHAIAGRVFDVISKMEFDVGEETKHSLTVSIGISEYPTDAKSAKEIIQFADEMMYQSKRSGRGKIFHIKEIKRDGE